MQIKATHIILHTGHEVNNKDLLMCLKAILKTESKATLERTSLGLETFKALMGVYHVPWSNTALNKPVTYLYLLVRFMGLRRYQQLKRQY